MDRMQKMERARRAQREEQCEVKAALSDGACHPPKLQLQVHQQRPTRVVAIGVIEQKKEYTALRRQSAMEGQFEMSVVLAKAKQRPQTAPPSPTKWETRANELRQLSSGKVWSS